MFRFIQPVLIIALACASCDSSQRTPSPPPVPDIALPGNVADAGKTAEAPDEADGGSAPMEDPRSPIAENLIEFIPEVLDGVRVRRRETVKTAPIVHGYYPGEKRKVYNLHITGPNQSEADRRAQYPLLGKDEKETSGPLELKGFKIDEFEGQRTYDAKRKKSEAVVLVNPFVEVKLSVAPTDKADESIKLLDEVDLKGVSKLR